jgi:hypothetical protein
MSVSGFASRGPARRGPYVVSGVLILVGIVVPLIVPVYARATPALAGIPFFYWYQMAWVFGDAILLAICYVLISREDRRRRDVVRGEGAHPAHARLGKSEGQK